MIGKALDFLATTLNQYIELRTGQEKRVVMKKVVNDEGKLTVGSDVVVGSLVNIEEERIGKHQGVYSRQQDGQVARQNPAVMLNLFVLFAVNPSDDHYTESLRLLSYVIGFFQGKGQFNPRNSPQMPPELTTLSVELYPISLENQNYLWGGLGAKYIPSVLYKVRLVTIRDDQEMQLGSTVTEIHTDLDDK